MEYRGFTIQKNKMKYVYGNKKWEVTNYLVYKEDNGEISYYNYINDLSRPDQKRQDRWFKDYFYDENIREESNNKYQTPEEFMMYMIYTSADVQNRAMKHKYSLN